MSNYNEKVAEKIYEKHGANVTRRHFLKKAAVPTTKRAFKNIYSKPLKLFESGFMQPNPVKLIISGILDVVAGVLHIAAGTLIFLFGWLIAPAWGVWKALRNHRLYHQHLEENGLHETDS